MSDKRLVGISLTKHYEDGSTEAWTKVPAPAVGAILAAGLATAPVGNRGTGGRFNYINADECPTHGKWKAVPAGTSKNTGNPYPAFWACDQEMGEERCLNKPSREWVETHPPDKADDDFSQQSSEPSSAPAQDADEFSSLPF